MQISWLKGIPILKVTKFFVNTDIMVIFVCSSGISTSVVHWLPKPRRGVRLPYPAPLWNRRIFPSFVFLNLSG